MLCENKTRFKKTEDALRFYFRLRELLHSGRARRLVADELPAAACLSAANAIDDYQGFGWCMQGLGEIDLWLLSEVYGPTCFGVHRRTFSHACKAGRLEFPNREFRLRQVGLDPPSCDRYRESAASRFGHDSASTNARCAGSPPPEGRAETRPRSRRPCRKSI